MAILDLLIYPHPILSQKAEPVDDFGPQLQTLIKDMAHTMYAGNGVGLAAPQVGLSRRLFIIDVSAPEGPKNLEVFINPTILSKSVPTLWNEGCLSLPGLFRDVPSFKNVSIRAQDASGKLFETQAVDLRAVAILHEFLHLEGEIFIDRLNPMKRRMTRKYWAKNRKSLAKEVYTELNVGYVLEESAESL